MTVVPLPKAVMKEPAKNRLASDEFVVMDRTSEAAPERPPKGGADHEEDEGSQTATDGAGDVK